MMKQLSLIIPLILLIIAGIVFMNSTFIVNETEQVIITQFGKPVDKPITEPGIHFKIPIIQTVNSIDKRFLEWDGNPNQVPTKDKRFIWVDTYARWRIFDPLLYYRRLKSEQQAQSRLDDILDGQTRNAIAKHNLIELVRNSNQQIISDMNQEEEPQPLPDKEDSFILGTIKIGRNAIAKLIIEEANKNTRELGIEILDFRFKRINYVDSVQRKIFIRMISERKKIAEKFRSEGRGEAAKILGQTEKKRKEIISDAERQAETIKGIADARATAIYASAYNQSADSRDFYRFLKTMETYKNVFSEKDWLILSTSNSFYRFLNNESTTDILLKEGRK